EAIGVSDEGLVEEREAGTGGGCREFAGGDGIDGADAFDPALDRHGEVIPADATFVAVVEDAGDEARSIDDVKDGGGEIGGVGRRTDLIGNDVDGGACLHQLDHGLYEVVAVFGIDPGSADDEGAIGVLFECAAFTFQLRSAVDIDGAGGVVLL